MSTALRRILLPILACTLAACGPAAGGGAHTAAAATQATALDVSLRQLINEASLTGAPETGRALPAPESPLAQLGMRLFFSKSLSGKFEVACASCHYPLLAGADQLSLSVGVDALRPELSGLGRATASGAPNVPRNAPTTFNLGLYDRVLFHDGRVESLDPQPKAGGAAGAIRTPDSTFGAADPSAGATLAAAQARFPETVDVEMRSDFLAGASNADYRDYLSERIGGFGDGAADLASNHWLPLFQAAFPGQSGAQNLVTADHIAQAIGAYERSQVLLDSPWRAYVGGNLAAISASAKRGALLFLDRPSAGGAGCSGCHRGDRFTDEAFHTVAFPQIGPGKGDGPHGDDDFGRFRESAQPQDRWAFRTPSLLNVGLTAPYGHDGAYATLADVVRHYRAPAQSVADYFSGKAWCALPQFAELPAATCAALYPDAQANSFAALDKLRRDNAAGVGLPPIRLDDGEVADLVAFLETLTDPCAADDDCLERWEPPDDGGPDGQQLEAVDRNGNPL